MGRRSSESNPDSADGRPVALEGDALGATGQEGGPEDRWAQWEEKWDRLEEERVARWLKAKVHPEPAIDLRDQADGPLGADRWQGETAASFLDEQRRRMTATVEAQRMEAERVRSAAQDSESAEAAGVVRRQPDDDGNARVEDWRTSEQPPRPHSKRATRRQGRLLPGWLIMTVLALGPVGLVAFEVTSPLVVRSQLEGVVRDAADGAVTELLEHDDLQRARLAAEAIAEDEDAVVTSLTVDQRGLRVVIERQAQSLLLKHLDRTASWYNVEVTATAATARN